MISINATLVLQVIHFLILAFILNRIMIRPIMKTIRKRETYVRKTWENIEELELESKRLAETFQRKDLNARRDAMRRRNELRDSGILEVKQMTDHSQQKAKAMKAEAEETAEKQVQGLSHSLDAEATVLADEIVERVMDRRTVA